MNNNRFESNQRYFTICIYTIFVILVACIIFRILFHWNAVVSMIKNFVLSMSSFIIGILIAFLVNPLMTTIHDRLLLKTFHWRKGKKSKVTAIFCSYSIVLGLLGIILFYIVPQFVESIVELSEKIPEVYTEFSDWLRNGTENMRFFNDHAMEEFMDTLYPKIMDVSTTMASRMIPWLYSISISVIQWMITILIAIVISIYILADKKIIFQTIKKLFYALLPGDRVDTVIDVLKNCNRIFTGYLVAKTLNSFIIGVLCFLLMSLLQLPYKVLISVIVGVTDIIPYFGPYIGAVPGILILSMIKIKYGVIFAIMILILQQFDGLVLGPRILGDSTGLRPILILFAITFGGAYMGVIGMFLGVPIVAVLQYLFQLFLAKKLKEKKGGIV